MWGGPSVIFTRIVGPAARAAHVVSMATTYRVWCTRANPCSWEKEYASLARSEYGQRRHSCSSQRALDARAACMADMGKAQAEVEPSPCPHERAVHTHGTRACSVHDMCQCAPCRHAHATYEYDRQRQHVYGRWENYVDAEPARAHVRTRQEAGLGYKQGDATTEPVTAGPRAGER